MAYPDENCNSCTPTPTVEVTPPPTCEGEPCAEAYPTLCTKYNGPAIEAFNIQEDINMNEVIMILAEFLQSCPTLPTYTATATCDTITITITNPLTSVDVYGFEYRKTGDPSWIYYDALYNEPYVMEIPNLDASTSYDIRVYKICGPACQGANVDDVISTIACD